jgi:uncharacterized protein
MAPWASEAEDDGGLQGPVKQGFDPSMLDDAMSAREVARLALDHITDGPTYISSEHYAAMIERMSALPRRRHWSRRRPR